MKAKYLVSVPELLRFAQGMSRFLLSDAINLLKSKKVWKYESSRLRWGFKFHGMYSIVLPHNLNQKNKESSFLISLRWGLLRPTEAGGSKCEILGMKKKILFYVLK